MTEEVKRRWKEKKKPKNKSEKQRTENEKIVWRLRMLKNNEKERDVMWKGWNNKEGEQKDIKARMIEEPRKITKSKNLIMGMRDIFNSYNFCSLSSPRCHNFLFEVEILPSTNSTTQLHYIQRA